ncbi:hypothetical protein HZA97_08310 [Candidatus Woesearchaeota archaeon]|nr:hypothetical protein [Candidatus Woesearchaeota archaeon]
MSNSINDAIAELIQGDIVRIVYEPLFFPFAGNNVIFGKYQGHDSESETINLTEVLGDVFASTQSTNQCIHYEQIKSLEKLSSEQLF